MHQMRMDRRANRRSGRPTRAARTFCGVLWLGIAIAASPAIAQNDDVCRIEIVEKDSGWPVPLVQLKTTHDQLFVTDNAGRIAIDDADLLNQQVFFHVEGHGYEVPADGFGYRGVRLNLKAGSTHRVEVERTIIARRLGRLTGAGLFVHSQRLGLETDWQESGVAGCDSVLAATHDGQHFWLWGDTNRLSYPLGIFHTSCATTALLPLEEFQPPLRVRFEYVRNAQGQPRAVAQMPGTGPTWLTGLVSLPDQEGQARLVACYAKIKPPLEEYETGLCVWNAATQNFDRLKTVWSKSSDSPHSPPAPKGHPVVVQEGDLSWVYFGNPLPSLRCPATFEAWQDESTWEVLTAQETLRAAEDGKPVEPHTGSIAWNQYRNRWVTVFMQKFGQPSAFGELWYAEADAPTGPWGSAVKVLSHNQYTFYNPRIHPTFTPNNSPVLLFEGTYTRTFSKNPLATPRYDYNQILYRLDLDDERLRGAH